VPRIPSAPPIPTAITRTTTAHSTAAASLSATSPGIPSPRWSRQPTRVTVDTASAREVLEPGKNPTKIPFPSLLIFPRISPNFLNSFPFLSPFPFSLFSYFLSFPSFFFFSFLPSPFFFLSPARLASSVVLDCTPAAARHGVPSSLLGAKPQADSAT
jgi:hypothetical protein